MELLGLALTGQPYVYLNYSVVLMGTVFALACGVYFYRLLMATPHRRISRHAPFWWVSGTAVFHFGGLASNSVLDLTIQQPVMVGELYTCTISPPTP